MSWTVPTRSVSSKLPSRSSSKARSRAAPPGANGAMKRSSETLPCRMPARPALSTRARGFDANDARSLIEFSSAVFAYCGASAYSCRRFLTLPSMLWFWFGLFTVAVCGAMSVLPWFGLSVIFDVRCQIRSSTNFVEQLVDRLADLFEPFGFGHGEIRRSDIPAVRSNLAACDPVLDRGVVHSLRRIAHHVAEQHVERIGNLGRKVVDIGVPVAVIRRGEQQSCVVVDEHEAHVVQGADLVRALEIAAQH